MSESVSLDGQSMPLRADGEILTPAIQRPEALEYQDQLREMNEALLLSVVRQHELAEAAEKLNRQLQAEIGERREMTRELAEKVRLLDLSNDAIIVRGSDNRITLWNAGAERMYGWTSAEAVGQDLHGLMRTEFPKPMEEIVEQLHREGSFIGEVVQTARDGRRIPSLCRWVRDPETGSILTSYTNLTERLLLEESLQARAADLAQADRSKNEFLAMLAHELRNPLAPVRNALEILQTPEADAGERGEAYGMILRQLGNMSRMIDDLLDVSRITEGKIELKCAAVALEPILAAAMRTAQFSAAQRRQSLDLSLPDSPVFLNADATRLEQIFNNLLGNACKYSGEGSRIRLSAKRTAGAEPPEVVIRVQDDGVGIAPELLPRLFDLFVQGSQSSDREHGGLGIGLTLVRRLVRLHGGRVEAHSEGAGRGSEFTVSLPVLEEAPPLPASAPPSAGRVKDTPRRILIVEDNRDAALSLARLQSHRGHTVHTAFSGPEAIAAAGEFLPGVVLLDIGLPGMDGFEVARRLRAMPELAGVFLVALSGYDSTEDHSRAQAAGFDRYLAKPADLTLLRGWLQNPPRGGRETNP
jgi:two-component system CheB/CheR fusion protein